MQNGKPRNSARFSWATRYITCKYAEARKLRALKRCGTGSSLNKTLAIDYRSKAKVVTILKCSGKM